MSRCETIRWMCCDQIFKVSIWRSINLQLTPDKLEELARGQLNNIVCPKCGLVLRSPWPVLFNDMGKRLWVWAGGAVHEGPAQSRWLTEKGYTVLSADDSIVAAQVLIALDKSDLPDNIRTLNPSLKDSEVYAEAFRILYDKARQ